MPMPKLKTLQPRIKTMGSVVEAMGVKTMRATKRSGRDADPRRTLPLNSAAWQRLRASVLHSEPLCRICKARGILTQATDVDHVSGDPSDNTPENLQPLCHECHSLKTARDHGKDVYMGCDVDGMPLDPSHPWSKTCALFKKSPATDGTRPPGPSRISANRK